MIKASSAGFMQVILSGIAFGFLGIFARLAYINDLSVGTLLTFRFAVASVLLWLYLFIFKRNLIAITKRQLIISFFLGICGYAVFSTMYFQSIKGMSVPLASMILFTFPLFVNAGSYFFLKENLSKQQISGLILGSLGLILLLWGEISVEKNSAVFFGIGAAVTYSIYVLVSGKLQQNIHPITSSLYVISSATLGLFLFHQPDLSQIPMMTNSQVAIVLGIAIICTIIPIALFLAGLQKMPSSKASIVVMVEPVTAAIAALFILGENMTLLQTVGAFLVLSGVFLEAKTK